MTTIEQNTKLFYKEFNGKCNEEILLQLAKKGIFLYEPLFKHDKIKNSDYAIDISILARQYYMINTESQYQHFFEIMDKFEEYNEFSLYERKYDCGSLLVINKFLIDRLLCETDDKHILLILNSFRSNLILKFLHKYKVISSDVFYLFNQREYYAESPKYEMYDYFYHKNNNYLFNDKIPSFKPEELFCFVRNVINYAYDIRILDYCSRVLERSQVKLPSYYSHNEKFLLNFPLKELQIYSNRIYKPNRLTYKHQNKYFETFINTVVPDKLLYCNENTPDSLYSFKVLSNLKRYEIDINTLKQTKCKIENKPKVNPFSYQNTNNKFKSKRIPYRNPNSCKENLFSTYILQDSKKIELLLEDYRNIFTFSVDFTKELFLIHISLIISLIHNHYNKFIIKYLVSFLKEYDYVITYEDDHINIYHRNSNHLNNYYIKTLINAPHDIFKSYLQFKERSELPECYRKRLLDQEDIILIIP